MHALEAVAVVLGILASLVVIAGAVPARRVYRFLLEQHRRTAILEDLAEEHNWPGRPPAGHHSPRGNRVHSL